MLPELWGWVKIRVGEGRLRDKDLWSPLEMRWFAEGVIWHSLETVLGETDRTGEIYK